jgi:hypothetical protein
MLGTSSISTSKQPGKRKDRPGWSLRISVPAEREHLIDALDYLVDQARTS